MPIATAAVCVLAPSPFAGDDAMYGNWRDWYGLGRWLKQRRYQLAREPLCRMCAAEGRVVAAEVVDHVKHHEGDWNAFWLGEPAPCRIFTWSPGLSPGRLGS